MHLIILYPCLRATWTSCRKIRASKAPSIIQISLRHFIALNCHTYSLTHTLALIATLLLRTYVRSTYTLVNTKLRNDA